MEKIVLNMCVGWTASEAKMVPGKPNEKIYKYTTGQILTVVPNLGPDDEYQEGTVPEGRAKGMCAHNIASDFTPEAMRESQAKLKEKRERLDRARAKMEADGE